MNNLPDTIKSVIGKYYDEKKYVIALSLKVYYMGEKYKKNLNSGADTIPFDKYKYKIAIRYSSKEELGKYVKRNQEIFIPILSIWNEMKKMNTCENDKNKLYNVFKHEENENLMKIINIILENETEKGEQIYCKETELYLPLTIYKKFLLIFNEVKEEEIEELLLKHLHKEYFNARYFCIIKRYSDIKRAS